MFAIIRRILGPSHFPILRTPTRGKPGNKPPVASDKPGGPPKDPRKDPKPKSKP